MCIAVVAWRCHEDWPLVVIANRDEFHERPAAALSKWEDGSGIIAGRDLRSGGTWLGVSGQAGRLALITNFSDPARHRADAPSRGHLVGDWLAGEWNHVGDRQEHFARYNGFSLILIDGAKGWIADNRTLAEPRPMDVSGFYGLSNGPFHEPWPKVDRLVDQMREALEEDRHLEQRLFRLLASDGPQAAADSEEAPIFIRHPAYGTRCSTVVTIDADGQGRIAEKRFDAKGNPTGKTTQAFRWLA